MASQVWTVGYLDADKQEQVIGFAHDAPGATNLAREFLWDRDLDLVLPWTTVSTGTWRMQADEDTVVLLWVQS